MHMHTRSHIVACIAEGVLCSVQVLMAADGRDLTGPSVGSVAGLKLQGLGMRKKESDPSAPKDGDVLTLEVRMPCIPCYRAVTTHASLAYLISRSLPGCIAYLGSRLLPGWWLQSKCQSNRLHTLALRIS
jgi:hypothetical protein